MKIKGDQDLNDKLFYRSIHRFPIEQPVIQIIKNSTHSYYQIMHQ